jgi:putative hydrolase of the HAD superfamily
MLERMRKSGKKIGIITDGRPEGQRAKLKALGIAVDHVIITDELGGVMYRKPNTKAFERMKQMMDFWDKE